MVKCQLCCTNSTNTSARQHQLIHCTFLHMAVLFEVLLLDFSTVFAEKHSHTSVTSIHASHTNPVTQVDSEYGCPVQEGGAMSKYVLQKSTIRRSRSTYTKPTMKDFVQIHAGTSNLSFVFKVIYFDSLWRLFTEVAPQISRLHARATCN